MNRVKVTLSLPEAIYKEILKSAHAYNCTPNKYVIRSIIKGFQLENKYGLPIQDKLS